ncbi:hypothetical protein, partial [Klebsiella variicola]|uniref:hypothetical protein n=1 Tax=Klebsiella variicola TaxID=244366 RepID=UPI0022E83080
WPLIRVIIQAADALAAFVHPGHVLVYAPGDLLTCRVIRPFGLTPSGPAQALFKTLSRFVLQLELFSVYSFELIFAQKSVKFSGF